jgi:hypothetical protein
MQPAPPHTAASCSSSCRRRRLAAQRARARSHAPRAARLWSVQSPRIGALRAAASPRLAALPSLRQPRRCAAFIVRPAAAAAPAAAPATSVICQAGRGGVSCGRGRLRPYTTPPAPRPRRACRGARRPRPSLHPPRTAVLRPPRSRPRAGGAARGAFAAPEPGGRSSVEAWAGPRQPGRSASIGRGPVTATGQRGGGSVGTERPAGGARCRRPRN